MPHIVFPPVTVARIADGFTALAADPNELLYSPNAASPDSLQGINGHLTTTNKEATWLLEHEDIQDRSLMIASATGATNNADYMNDWFEGAQWDDVDDPADDNPVRFIPIYGAGRTFYLHFAPTYLLFTWNIVWTNTSMALDEPTILRLFINGSPRTYQRRQVSYVTQLNIPARQGVRDRHWCGHELITSVYPVGWHTAGLQICAAASQIPVDQVKNTLATKIDSDAQSRVRVRGFRVFAFR
jgi:hypothetical protein